MKKMLFSDMDGTIIEYNEIKNERDRDLLLELKKQGHLIAFNTGRNFQEATRVVEECQFPFDYLVLNNGAHIVDKEGKEIFKKIIPQSIGRRIIEHVMTMPDMFVFFYDGKRTLGYCNHETYEHASVGNVVIHDVCFQDEYLKVDEFDIIAVFQANEEIEQTLEVQRFIEDNFGDIARGTLNVHYLDITAQGCSKGSGIQALEKIIDEDIDSYSIGDSYNDISMFEVANHSYTFHDVKEDIYKHADKQVQFVYEVIEDMLREV